MAPPLATTILPTHRPRQFRAAVEQAAAALRTGQAVALPTETVYGLAANALDPSAVSRLFQIKGRPGHNPLIVHIHQLDMARRCVTHWPWTAEALARAFWPGPLTFVLPKAPTIPEIVTADNPTVAIRWPAHPLFQAVIQACGFPLAAPSANPSGATSPTLASHVLHSLGGRIPLILDGGPCQIGIESTVVDLTQPQPRILRLGLVDESSLSAVVGPVQGPAKTDAASPLLSPGLLDRHYAPKIPLRVLSWIDDADLEQQISGLLSLRGELPFPSHAPASRWPVCLLAHTRIPARPKVQHLRILPRQPAAYARRLYAELHRCDQTTAQLILVEALPLTPAWSAIADRLRRAAG